MFEKLKSQAFKTANKFFEERKFSDRDLVRMYFTDCTFVRCDFSECDLRWCLDNDFRVADSKFESCKFAADTKNYFEHASEDCTFSD